MFLPQPKGARSVARDQRWRHRFPRFFDLVDNRESGNYSEKGIPYSTVVSVVALASIRIGGGRLSGVGVGALRQVVASPPQA